MHSSPTPTRTNVATPRFVVTRVGTNEQLEAAARLREQIFRERRRIHFDSELEARRDREGHVFLLSDRAQPVAVGRVLPYPSRLSPLVDLSRIAGTASADSEIGRVACIASDEATRYALSLLTLGSQWLLEHTRLRRYIGYCHPKLLDFYRTLGAIVGAAIDVPGRSDRYVVISGSYEAAANAGSRLLGPP